MAEFVDKAKLMSRIESELIRWGENEYNALQILGDIEDFPTTDVVEVVRCEKCKDFEPHGNGIAGICRNKKLKPCLRYATDFCSYGEKSSTKMSVNYKSSKNER